MYPFQTKHQINGAHAPESRKCSQQLLAPYKRLTDNSSKTNYKRKDWLDNWYTCSLTNNKQNVQNE